MTTVTSALSTSVADGRPAMVMGAVEGLRVFGAHTAGGGRGMPARAEECFRKLGGQQIEIVRVAAV